MDQNSRLDGLEYQLIKTAQRGAVSITDEAWHHLGNAGWFFEMLQNSPLRFIHGEIGLMRNVLQEQQAAPLLTLFDVLGQGKGSGCKNMFLINLHVNELGW